MALRIPPLADDLVQPGKILHRAGNTQALATPSQHQVRRQRKREILDRQNFLVPHAPLPPQAAQRNGILCQHDVTAVVLQHAEGENQDRRENEGHAKPHRRCDARVGPIQRREHEEQHRRYKQHQHHHYRSVCHGRNRKDGAFLRAPPAAAVFETGQPAVD